MQLNLPNALTIGRIAATPLIAWLPLMGSPTLRLIGFTLYLLAAFSDYYDGMLARTRNLVTDTGRLLDPLADKLLLVATLLPMYVLQHHYRDPATVEMLAAGARGVGSFPFLTPFGRVFLPLTVVIVILGREVLMTVFRQAAARRGVVISAIGSAKWKTGFQLTWVGAAYFWFFIATLAAQKGWDGRGWWTVFSQFNGMIGVLSMVGAVLLTLYSLVLYVRRYGSVFTGTATRAAP